MKILYRVIKKAAHKLKELMEEMKQQFYNMTSVWEVILSQ